jgi:hypothetical protein
MRAMLWPLYAWSACAQPDTVLAGTTFEGAAMASVRLSSSAQPASVVAGTTGEGVAISSVRSVSVESARHCGGGYDR